ncbi:MAG: hypothetical protein A6F71_05800 [Cycloclasticus sp. symbiont of Poecilosclerida sp. M]|nr:MAG: hypothetical protein A6F71_05800 [Cycloclasticus sp. symbiont of Poecilosclerida sp. M]
MLHHPPLGLFIAEDVCYGPSSLLGPVLEELLVDTSLLVSIGVLLHNISAIAANKKGEEMTL